jgi:uncharacterized protein YjbI with pentapeptide repeats
MEADTSSDQRPVIQAREILAKIERSEDVEYDGVIVEGDLDLSGLELPTEHLHRKDLQKVIGLSDERKVVGSQITITNSKILGNIDFSNTYFKENITFTGSEFVKKAEFWDVGFGSIANFDETKFSGEYTTFLLSEFNAFADFSGANFIEEASFNGANFAENADFIGCYFGGDAEFRRCQFCQDVSFKNTTFFHPANQEVASRIAKRKKEDLGYKDDADYYFYNEMKSIRIQKGIKGTKKLMWPWKMRVSEWLKLAGSKIWRLGRYDIFEYIFIQGIFGYGVRPLRLFVFWILMALAFASIYWYFDAVEGASEWFDYIWFSIATSATPGYALYNPIGHYKIVTGIQAIIGTFMWAAFIATFARKWQR